MLPFYLLVGAATAVQNVIPVPIADVAVLFAAFLVAAAHADPIGVFAAAWCGNTGGAALLYAVAHRYRTSFPESWVVRRLMKRRAAHDQNPRRWDLPSVFVASFLPVRPLLPVYAGLQQIPFWRVIVPIGVAAALWYTGVVLVGATGGANFQAVVRTFRSYNRILTFIALGAVVIAGAVWLVRRRRP